jgi:hypothetical protein
MTMYRRILAVVAVVLVVAGVGGFFMLKESAPGPLTWSYRAQVTGYAISTIRGRTSGAVSVDLDGASAARIDTIVEGLPRANLRYICAENAQEYHITFSAEAGAGVKQGFDLTGYWCNNLVVEVPLHGRTEDRIDRDCTLLSAVRRLLPASAIATQSGTCAHANGRLFLAASRHATRTHKTPTHKTPVLKSPAHKSARHKSPRREAPKHGAVKRGTPVRVMPGYGAPVRVISGRGTETRDAGRVMSERGTQSRETSDVKKAVMAPTLG